MNQVLMTELERNKKRLDYYSWLKQKTGGQSPIVDKWIEIYSARAKRLESQLQRQQKLEASAQRELH